MRFNKVSYSAYRFVEKKKVHRAAEREKRREKHKLERQNGGLSKDELRALQLQRLEQATRNNIKVGIDLQFDDAMNEKVRIARSISAVTVPTSRYGTGTTQVTVGTIKIIISNPGPFFKCF